MQDIELIDIFMIAALLVGIYGLFRELNRRKYEGDLLLVVPKDRTVKVAILFWMVMGCFWLFVSIDMAQSTAKYFADYPIRRVSTPGLVLFSVVLHLVRAKRANEIRQKGVYMKEIFTEWQDINSYRWVESDKLEVVVRQKIPLFPEWKTTKLWVVEEGYRERVDQIFHQYVHENPCE